MQATTSLTGSDVTAAIGFFLTLIGLIGTFFYVHLSNWLREILELQAKYELNQFGETEARKEGRLECRFQLRRLLNHIPLLVALVISAFIVLVVVVAWQLVDRVDPKPPVIAYYGIAGISFLVIYFGLTGYLLIYGYAVAYRLGKVLRPKGTVSGG